MWTSMIATWLIRAKNTEDKKKKKELKFQDLMLKMSNILATN